MRKIGDEWISVYCIVLTGMVDLTMTFSGQRSLLSRLLCEMDKEMV